MEVGVGHLPGLAVEHAFFGHAQADAHHDAAEDLVVVGQAVEDPARVVGAEEVQKPDLTGSGVDLDLAELGGKWERDLVFGIGVTIAGADHEPLPAELLECR